MHFFRPMLHIFMVTSSGVTSMPIYRGAHRQRIWPNVHVCLGDYFWYFKIRQSYYKKLSIYCNKQYPLPFICISSNIHVSRIDIRWVLFPISITLTLFPYMRSYTKYSMNVIGNFIYKINSLICDDEFEIFHQDFSIYFETTILVFNINHIIYCFIAQNM